MIERLRVEGIFVIFCCVLFVLIKCENCAYAPTCPDISTWKPGFICEDKFIAIIKIRFIDGSRTKTICCRAINNCNEKFWFKPPSNIEILMENSSLPMRTSCASGCSPIWKTFEPNKIVNDGIRAGLFTPSISSFIGRTLVNGELQIGRIQVSHPSGLYYTLDGSVSFSNSSIEYLENSNYIWKNSSYGALVKNAVTVTAVKNLPFYIGRIQINGFSYIGTVVRVLGLMYYGDEHGIERTTDCYEVLTCPGREDEVTSSFVDVTSSNVELATIVDFEATISPITVGSGYSTQNSSHLVNQSMTIPASHPDLYPTNISAESSIFIENSSQFPLMMNQTIIKDSNNSNGYSYLPPSMSFSLSTSTEQSPGNLNIIESSSAQTLSTENLIFLIETSTALYPYKPSNSTSTISQSNPTDSTSSLSSQLHITKPQNAQSSTTAPISMQVPSLSFNEFLSSTLMLQSMSQMSSSTEKASATTTTKNNNEAGEQIALQQLISSTENEESLSQNLGGNSWSNASGIGGDLGINTDGKPTAVSLGSIGSDNEMNLGQFVVENVGDVEGFGLDLNVSQSTTIEATEDVFMQNNGHTTERLVISSVASINTHSGHQDHNITKNPSQTSSTQSTSITKPTISKTTRTRSTRKTTRKASTPFEKPEDIILSNLEFTSTEANDLSSLSTNLVNLNEYTSSNLLNLITNDSGRSTTNSYSHFTKDNEETEVYTPNHNSQITKKPTTSQEYVTQTTNSRVPSLDFTTTNSAVAETTTKLDLEFQHLTSTLAVLPETLNTSSHSQEQSSLNLHTTIATTEEPKQTTTNSKEETTSKVEELTTTKAEDIIPTTSKLTVRPIYTPRSTTSRTTRTRFTRRTSTRKTSTVEEQSENNSKPGWLFTTAATIEGGVEGQPIIDFEDVGVDISTERIEVVDVKEMFECVPHWKQLPTKSSFLFDGIEVTSQNTNILSYIGKVNINNSHILGKINLNPQNYPTFSFHYNNTNHVSTTDPITYLSKAQLQNYSWKVSSNGLAVKNAISINHSGNWPYYIGRVKSNGVILIGKVLPSIGLVYADKYGSEKITKAYEVLTCEAVVDEGGGCKWQ